MSGDGLKLTAKVEKLHCGKTFIDVFYGAYWLGNLRAPNEDANQIVALLNGETEKGEAGATIDDSATETAPETESGDGRV